MITFPEGCAVVRPGRVLATCHVCRSRFEATLPTFEVGRLMVIRAFICSDACIVEQAKREDAAGATEMGPTYDTTGKRLDPHD